jgi:hypothetical protein
MALSLVFRIVGKGNSAERPSVGQMQVCGPSGKAPSRCDIPCSYSFIFFISVRPYNPLIAYRCRLSWLLLKLSL